MPPKKKKLGGRKGGKRSLKRGAVIDGVAITDMTKEQLEGHVYRLQKEAEREREERNYFQVERDKIKAFWDVTKQQLEEKETQLQLKQKELEDAELSHLSEIKVYKEKMKHVMLEYQQHLNSNRKENMVALKIAENDHHHEESMLWKEKNELKTNVNQLMLEHNDTIKNIKLKHGQELHTLRQEFERKMGSFKDKYDEQLEYIKQEQEQRKRREIQEIEERKNQHIGNLIKTHDKSFIDMKNYYNDITQNNLSLINTLKEQVKSMRKKEERMEKQAETLSQKNEKLDEELCRAQEELTKLRKQINNYEREKDHYTVAKDKMKTMNNEIKGLKWENDVLIQQFKKVEKERDSLYNKFKLAIQDVEEKIGFKTLLLEKKMVLLKEELEKKDAELNQALSSPSSVESSAVTRKLEDALEAKHSVLKNLQVELAKVNKTNTLLLRSYETKLKYHGTSSSSSKDDSFGIRGERAVKSARPSSQRHRSIEDCLISRKMT